MGKEKINFKIKKFLNMKEIETTKKRERKKYIKEKSLIIEKNNSIKLSNTKNIENNNNSNKRKIKKNIFFKQNHINYLSLVVILAIIILPSSLSKFNNKSQYNSKKGNFNYQNQITLIVKGKYFQKIISPFIKKPDLITINNKVHLINGYMIFYFNEDNNIVVLKWNSLLISCKEMFKDIKSIISIDLSNFNTEKVEDMSGMFNGCSQLKYINFKNVNTSGVKNMEYMFYNTPLTSLDLSNFNTSLVNKMNYMFYKTNSLKYINLISFEEKEGVEINDIFSNNINNLIYCINKGKAKKISDILESQNFISDCEIFKNNDSEHAIIINIYEDNENSNKTQNPKIVNKDSLEDIINQLNNIIIENIKNKDEIIQNIKENLINGNLDSLIENITKAKKDLIIKTNDTLYQITNTEHQKNNKYNNMSTLNLGNCEERLKNIYNIDKSLPLIIFKIDYYKENSFIPVICYEVYHPENKSQLDLNYCKDILISLNIPVSIDEDNYFKYDPNSGYYTDECYTYTTENGTDIILDDRQNEYNDNNYFICEKNCTLMGYNNDTKKASCECETKPKISLISEIIEDENILSNYFNDTDNYSSSIVAMKCVYTLFTKDGLLKNIGNYILITSIIIFVISSILFYKCGYHIIETEIKEIIDLRIKNNENNDKSNIFEVRLRKRKISKKKKKVSIFTPINNPIKKIYLKKNSAKVKEHINLTYSKAELRNANILSNNSHIINNNNNISIYKEQNHENEKVNKYKNYDLNFFNYKEALIYDKRTFAQYYLDLLKIKNLILFSFYPIEDYNIKIIKISLFFLFFDIYFAINTLFFNDFTIHQIYIDKGAYNIRYLIPQIIYSFIISFFISNIIKFLTLSERNFYNLKFEKNIDDLNEKARDVKRCLIIKYILYFTISFLFLILFWFYLSSFCAVYKNSQIYLFKNTIISFCLSIVFSFIILLLPSILRIYSLKQEKSVIFKLGNIIEMAL